MKQNWHYECAAIGRIISHHMISHVVTWWSHDLTWSHTWSHDGHMMSHGITWSHVVTWCHVTSFKPISLHLTWQKSEHFSETAKNPFSLEHRNRRLCFMKSAFWGRTKSIQVPVSSWGCFLQKDPGCEAKSHERCAQLTVSYSAFPPRATQKKFSGSEPSWITTLEYVGCEETRVIWNSQTLKSIPL